MTLRLKNDFNMELINSFEILSNSVDQNKPNVEKIYISEKRTKRDALFDEMWVEIQRKREAKKL
jgi:hypothetical protein